MSQTEAPPTDEPRPEATATPDPRRRAPEPPAPAILELRDLSKSFAGQKAVDEVSLNVQTGEFFALLGPSGSGKTTLLRLLAGFETPDRGQILIGGEDQAGVPPYRRPLNMMFQAYALFPHMTVEGNVAFGLRQVRLPKREIAERVEELLDLVRLRDFAKRKPDQLSGGQRQRVALARALAKRPKILLLDEPLAALDKKLRIETQAELVAIQKRTGITFLIVTHDQEEAMRIADRIAVMHEGRILQVATPAELYESPNSRFIAEFIGDVNLIAARLIAADGESLTLRAMGAEVRIVAPPDAAGHRPGASLWLALRPEKIALHKTPPAEGNCFGGRIADIVYLGTVSTYRVETENGPLLKVSETNRERASERGLKPGDRVWLSFEPRAASVLEA
jgi:putrescine transport system ATP-binding protein